MFNPIPFTYSIDIQCKWFNFLGMSSRLRSQVPSATFINYDTFKISQMNIEDNADGSAKQDPSESTQGQTEDSQGQFIMSLMGLIA